VKFVKSRVIFLGLEKVKEQSREMAKKNMSPLKCHGKRQALIKLIEILPWKK